MTTSTPWGMSEAAAGVVASVAGLTVALVFVLGARRLWGTTLIAPCVWAFVSVGCATAVAFEHFFAAEETYAPVRFFVAAGTFCPLMAVLGAKRPQNVGWQWVVASLWLVLVWPAGQAILAGTGLELFIAWKLFLVGLIVVGLLNYLPTRNWLASLLVAMGQSAWVAEFVWTESEFDPGEMLLLGMVFFLAAALKVSGTFFWRNRSRELDETRQKVPDNYDRLWLQFRDAYGAFWALRILGRVNETAALQDWPIRLQWQGFFPTKEQQPSDRQMRELEQCWTTLMRRFL